MLHLKIKHRPQKFRAILSLLLAFAFIAISGIQIFHTHDHTSLKDDADHTEFYQTEKCVICDYITHQQAQPAQLPYPPVLLIPIPKPVKLQRNTFTGIYKSTSHGFTNKAPPVIAC